eukprot:12920890-Prorocentrum_lima.AAC.1
MGVSAHILAAIQKLYARPRFAVRIDGTSIDCNPHQTGIRQGCPLSPYVCDLDFGAYECG